MVLFKIKAINFFFVCQMTSDKSSTKSDLLSPADKTFTPGESGTSSGTSVASSLKIEGDAEACDQQKFVAFISQIHQLFKCCQVEGCGNLVECNFSNRGGVVHVHLVLQILSQRILE